ncbi:26S proteasome non-ATPase regulatory subunit-like protein [Artemisia annua]|uniref:26S proteasome non-ATPase regulatory subunit-like protein n=1 Tax=Artemisia annua TaxID=35608 RepID=A0A2U1KAH4_ARTAN|nr:26S proteasome non-ATPase regulatory subunit-like protein [Artemisia annua]
MDALEKKFDEGRAPAQASTFEFSDPTKQTSTLTSTFEVPDPTKLATKPNPYVPQARRGYDDIGLDLGNSNGESSTTIGKNLRPDYWDVDGSSKRKTSDLNDEQFNGEHKNSKFFLTANIKTTIMMAEEVIFIVFDNSIWMRNKFSGSYDNQLEVIRLYCHAKLQSNPKNAIGFKTMGGLGVFSSYLAPTTDVDKIMTYLRRGILYGGDLDLIRGVTFSLSLIMQPQFQAKHKRVRLCAPAGAHVPNVKRKLVRGGRGGV